MAEVIARHVVVHGMVQGVWFRASTRDEADRLGVSGWARNRWDGTVELHVEGPPESVEAVLDWIRAGGPPRAHVTDVEVEETTPAGASGFQIVR